MIAIGLGGLPWSKDRHAWPKSPIVSFARVPEMALDADGKRICNSLTYVESHTVSVRCAIKECKDSSGSNSITG